jgi:hypothetical protein
VNDKPPTITYESPKFTFSTGVVARRVGDPEGPVAPLSTSTGTTYSISPALPPGLTLDTSNGSITGTPTAASPAAAYTISAQTVSGQGTFNLTLEVDSSIVLELGHGAEVGFINGSASRMVSLDATGHWVLWDYAAGTAVTSGDNAGIGYDSGSAAPEVAGSTLAIRTYSGFELYSSIDGHALSKIAADVAWWYLASDGSYICAYNKTAPGPVGLIAWSPSGQTLFTRQGDYVYASARTFCAPGEIRVAAGPTGANTIETIAVPSGNATTSPSFQGIFGSWFLDGGRFLTSGIGAQASTVFVYSKDVVQQDALVLPTPTSMTGQGNYLWVEHGTLDIYAVGNSSSPMASYTLNAGDAVVPSVMTIGILHDPSGVSVIDLSGATPTKVDYTTGLRNRDGNEVYGALSSTQWLVSGGVGILLDGSTPTPRQLTLGTVSSIAASASEIAVATGAGQILYFDATTLAPQGTINFRSSKLVMSPDGLVLAALGDQSYADCSVNVYSLPSGSVLHSWPYGCSGVWAIDIALSSSGTLLGQLLDGSNPTFNVFPATGGPQLYSVPAEQVVFTATPGSGETRGFISAFMSPNAMQVLTLSEAGSLATNLYQSGNFVTAVFGFSGGWIDDNRFIVNNYNGFYYQSCTIYDTTGHSTGTCALPETRRFQTVSSSSIYTPFYNSIFSLSTGAKTWASGNAADVEAATAVAGSRIVFKSGHAIVAQSY